MSKKTFHPLEINLKNYQNSGNKINLKVLIMLPSKKSSTYSLHLMIIKLPIVTYLENNRERKK